MLEAWTNRKSRCTFGYNWYLLHFKFISLSFILVLVHVLAFHIFLLISYLIEKLNPAEMLIYDRVSMAMCIKETAWEIIGCYIGLHLMCNSISRGYHTQWGWFIPFLYPSTCWRQAWGASAGKICRHFLWEIIFLFLNSFLFWLYFFLTCHNQG